MARDKIEGLSFWNGLPRIEGKVSGAVAIDGGQREEFLGMVKREKQFMERNGQGGVENRSEWQQPIFYGVLVKPDGRFWIYKRGGVGSVYKEGRLATKIAMGVGGHIEPYDADLEASLYRELDEEVRMNKREDLQVEVVGLVKDDRDLDGGVHQVHVGLVCRAVLEDDVEVEMREGENQQGWWVSLPEYRRQVDEEIIEPELWTRLVIENLAEVLGLR